MAFVMLEASARLVSQLLLWKTTLSANQEDLSLTAIKPQIFRLTIVSGKSLGEVRDLLRWVFSPVSSYPVSQIPIQNKIFEMGFLTCFLIYPVSEIPIQSTIFEVGFLTRFLISSV